MNTSTIERIRSVLSEDYVRKLLIKFFSDHGYSDSFDRLLYPPILEGLPRLIPQLATKVEVEPYAKEIDPTTNSATLGWNLFVLGSWRMFVGETKHSDLRKLMQELRQGRPVLEGIALRQTTPRKVVGFISHVLGRSENGHIDPDFVPTPSFKPRLSGGAPGLMPRMGASPYR